jgi:protein-tyrosine-phosphatase
MPASGTILVVCTANVCRSPMAEKLLQHALAAEAEPLKSYRVVSAGIAAAAGMPATDLSVAALRKVGIDLTGHNSRLLTQALLDEARVVLCMTETHRAMIQLNFDRVPQHIYLFRQFVGDGHDVEIPDPYGLSYQTYVACRDSMVEAIPSLVRFLRELVQPQAE